MRDARISFLKLISAILVGLAVTIGPIVAVADGDDDSRPGVSISGEQRDQIRNLHEAYRSALANLDWSAGPDGHAPDTLRQARELRVALRAEIFDVIHRNGKSAPASRQGECPYSGEAVPVRVKAGPGTLYL